MILFLAVGCGGIETDLHNPDPAQCLGGLEEIARFDNYAAPHQLVWHDGTLYFNGLAHDPSLLGTNAVSDQGGALTKFTDGYHWMQAEGDNLLLAMNDKFYAMPFSGGLGQLLADGGTSQVEGVYYGDVFVHAADKDFFYWTLDGTGDSGYSVWAKPRSGGPSVKMGVADPNQGFGVSSSLTPAGQDVILASISGYAWAIDKTTLQWRALASCPAFQYHTFVDTSGALWTSYTGGVGEHEHYAMAQSSISGQPLRPFWQSKPSRMAAYDMFPDGSGGWVMSAMEWFSDGQVHSSVWTLDSGQHGQRRACLPARENASVVAVAYSPQSIFLAVFAWPTSGDYYTSLYRLARP